MSEPTDGTVAPDTTDEGSAGGSTVPHTGEPAVDQALAALEDLDSLPLDDHHQRLARVHEDLHRALNPG